MKLFGDPGSNCTRKVLTTFYEKGVAFELTPVVLAKGDHKAPSFLARQPFGQVPAIEDGDYRLFESRAIIRYVDATQPGPSLTPSDPKGRGLMDQWMSVETSNFTPHAMGILHQLFFGPAHGHAPDLAKVDESRKKLGAVLAVIDAHLARSPYFVGSAFTLADVCYMPYVQYLSQTDANDVITSHPNVAAWWARVSARASWKKVTGAGS
jgi:glutathione S-transferase